MNKRVISVLMCLMAVIFMVSCTSEKEDLHTETTEAEVTTEKEISTNAEENETYNFEGVRPVKAYTLSLGETKAFEGEVIAADGYEVEISKENNKEVVAKKSGVSLVAVNENDGESIYAVCVLKEGQVRDNSAGSLLVKSVGSFEFFSGAASGAKLFSSCEDVATIDKSGKITFVGEGYAAISSEGVSVPVVVNYVVYEGK